jgi:hypothetical protein
LLGLTVRSVLSSDPILGAVKMFCTGTRVYRHDVNLTARLLDHVKPDKVLVCEAAKELAGGV